MDSPTAAPASAPVETAAPAPAAAPTTQSATQAAISSGNTADYRAARRAERIGKPLDPVAVAPAAADAPAVAPVAIEPKPPTRKEREQQETNERVRAAVERATADLRAENDRLKTPTPPVASAPPKDTFPTMAEYSQAHPEASLEDYMDARADHRKARETATAQSATEAEELTVAQQVRVETFINRLKETSTADPTFSAKLTPDVKALKPFGALTPGEASGPRNVIAEQIYDSPVAPQILLHLSQHPEVLKSLETMPAHILALPRAARTNAHIQHIVRQFGALESTLASAAVAPASVPVAPKTLTDAPATAQVLGSRASAAVDPKLAAVKSGDTRAYRAIRRQERADALRR